MPPGARRVLCRRGAVARGGAGAILCFYESGKPGETRRGGDWAYARLTVARFSLEWLGDGR